VHIVEVGAGPGAEVRALTDRGLSHRLPAFSPDGSRIATLASDERLVPSHGQVVVVDVATGKQRV
jgi:Periplasmic component of the Tol biopolymer transport system